MSRQYILVDRTPEPCDDITTWGEWFHETANRRVAQHEIGGVAVSTVFLGIDHGYGDGPPVLFETMVFGGELDGEQKRYSTWEEAEQGHKEMLERINGTRRSSSSL